MSDEGIRLVMRVALLAFLIVGAAFFRVLVGPGRRRGRLMLLGTLGGLAAGVLLAQPIHSWFGAELSVILASIGMVLGWAVAWTWARKNPPRSKLTRYRKLRQASAVAQSQFGSGTVEDGEAVTTR